MQTSIIALTLLALSLIAPPAAASQSAMAEFEGETLDLAESWGEATACHVAQEGVTCFRTEAAMDQWLAETRSQDAETGPAPASASCSGNLRLYDGASYSGTVLNLSTRQTWLNLSAYGFDQRTSSYKVGPCSASFADLANGGFPRYPSYLTEAHDQSTSMLSGWNNDVSSVYIH
ncbi:MAG: hypothetical protein AB1Z57_05270 [Acidimicrobiia bacterium]